MPMARQVWKGHFDYATVQEALAADTWMTSWKEEHFANVRPAGTTQSVSAIIPTDVDSGSNGRLTFEIHLEAADDPAIQAILMEIGGAISDNPGSVLQCTDGMSESLPE
jgi:hypothetical protein